MWWKSHYTKYLERQLLEQERKHDKAFRDLKDSYEHRLGQLEVERREFRDRLLLQWGLPPIDYKPPNQGIDEEYTDKQPRVGWQEQRIKEAQEQEERMWEAIERERLQARASEFKNGDL